MFGNKVYELSLVKDYVSHWGLAEAARELIQNALDSPSPFKFAFMPGGESAPDKWCFTLLSENSRLEPHHLLLGSTSKGRDKAAIGSFGEGFKIALLVLTRLGHDVAVQNNEFLWRPMFRFNKTYGTELLCIEEQKLAKSEPGLSFSIEGLEDADRATIESCCLKMQPEVGQLIPTKFGDILLDRPGELYVGSLFVTKNDMKFGYNVKPEHLSLERDRQTVSDWDLRCLTRDMWYDSKRFDEVAQMIFDDVPDLYYARYSAPEMVKAAVFEIFRAQHPGAILAESPSELKKAVEKGITKTVYVGGGVHGVLSSYETYRAHKDDMVPVQSPSQFLMSWRNANKDAFTPLGLKHFEEQVMVAANGWTAK